MGEFFNGLSRMFGKGEGGGSEKALPASRSAAERNAMRQTASDLARGEALEAGRPKVHEVVDEDILPDDEQKAA